MDNSKTPEHDDTQVCIQSIRMWYFLSYTLRIKRFHPEALSIHFLTDRCRTVQQSFSKSNHFLEDNVLKNNQDCMKEQGSLPFWSIYFVKLTLKLVEILITVCTVQWNVIPLPFHLVLFTWNSLPIIAYTYNKNTNKNVVFINKSIYANLYIVTTQACANLFL